MNRYTLAVLVTKTQTRVLLTQGPDELLRAVLPPPWQVRSESAAQSLLQGIATWVDRPLHVVLSAAEEQLSFCLGLTDELGCARNSVFYTVQVVDRGAPRRRGRRLRGIGDFRQLHLLSRDELEGGAL